MNLESLIGRSLRQWNLRFLDFPESPCGVELPAPDPGSSYLLYLHVPYCTVLCPFCSFHRVKYERRGATSYFDSLRKEIALVSKAGYRFDEFYIGGGTPTVMPDELMRTVKELRAEHPITAVSVETNPNSVDVAGLHALREAGINRLSVGVQSFDDALLEEMRRLQKYGSGAEIRARLRDMEGIFDTLNVDMIFNFPHQGEDSLRRDLGILTEELGVDQVSWYPLMAAGDTANKMRRTMGQIDESREKAFYQIVAQHMLDAGYQRASAWCFSRKSGMFDEYIVDREEYVGLGSGAFSYLDGGLYASTFSIDHYRQLVAEGKTGTVRRRQMTERERMRYYLLMQLFGGALDKRRAEALFAGRFQRQLAIELAALFAYGAIRQSEHEILLTERGYYLWVTFMREFFTGVNSLRDQMRHNIANENQVLRAQDTN